MSDDPDTFPRDLRRQWLSGRAEQIFEELHTAFSKYLADVQPERAKQLLDVLDQAPLVPGQSAKDQAAVHVMMAWSQGLAEGALIAVALQLAREEAREAPTEN